MKSYHKQLAERIVGQFLFNNSTGDTGNRIVITKGVNNVGTYSKTQLVTKIMRELRTASKITKFNINLLKDMNTLTNLERQK